MTEQNPGAAVHELVSLREQLTGWIAKLDEVGGQASGRVAERIRADYVDRLQRVNEDLAAHRGEIAADLERFRAALAEAEQQRLAAADEMDEASLRHLIGELDQAAWDEARPALEERVREADEAVASARAEVERLETLATDIEGAATAPEAPTAPEEEPAFEEPSAEPEPSVAEEAPAEPETAAAEAGPTPFDAAAMEEFEPQLPEEEAKAAEEPAEASGEDTVESPPPADVRAAAEAASVDEWDPFGGEFGAEVRQGDAEEDLPWLEGIDQSTGGFTPPAADEGTDFLREIEESTRTPAEPAAGDLGADDLAFLEELDRAIGGAPAGGGKGATPPPSDAAAQQPSAGPGSKAEPLLCKECGAINEPHSWYCEICGSEL